ncbi:WD repeat-containing protein 90 isoform X2 [Tachyglossus aculeatus]|uniref:WD repeat-containing protein 90 isoform X2 n=1 Tax=Tachyglossus aculeatus TaxID=9261 RepID=UPI0018F503A0|nr:WD repeat-containing protein 90 isoform X2 [Tachyglossus aculeatus]
MASVWQHPYLNVFKHFKVEEWKRSAKEGDVTTVMDKTLKGTVYRIRGSIPASNFVQLPKTGSQSLGLTGRHVYLLFKPLPAKYFVFHLDVVTEDSQVVRISFSNLFKEFKSSATWLQFPFICKAPRGSEDDGTAKTAKQDHIGVASASGRWTCLQMDLNLTLALFLNRRYSHLKSVKLCANLLVKNLFTSDLLFDPGITCSEARRAKLALPGSSAMPREMAFPVSKGQSWHDRYTFIRFPSDGPLAPPDWIQRGGSPLPEGPACPLPRLVPLSRPVQDRVALVQQITSPLARPRSPPPGMRTPPEGSQAGPGRPAAASDRHRDAGGRELRAGGDATGPAFPGDDEGGCRGSPRGPAGDPGGPGDARTDEVAHTPTPRSAVASDKRAVQHSELLPDPILKLRGIIGFGGCSANQALWTRDGTSVVYACHAVVVAMQTETREQRFFVGHTNKVSSLALSESSGLLASAQTGPLCLVRLWHFPTARCLAMFKSPVRSVCSLSFSYSGVVLCGVGKDGHGKTMVVVWNTAQARLGGDVVVLAKAHTDADIRVMKIAFFDDTRMVSCGRDNVRLWRMRGGALRSCPVALGEYHALDFTDLAFEAGQSADRAPEDRLLFACSRSGHILDIDYAGLTVQNARRLLPSRARPARPRERQTVGSGPGIAINSISVSSAFCATGSDDGYLRLWPLDFSSVFLEAEHEGPVSRASISPDGLRVLSTTSTGNLGFLDVPSRRYSTLMRSHGDSIVAFASEGQRRQLATASRDRTVRVWDLDARQQLFDFTARDAETPGPVAFHPSRPLLACGSSGGVVRTFSLADSDLLAEHRQHQGAVTGLAFSPDGAYMFSCCTRGTVALYSCSLQKPSVVRVLGNVACPGTRPGPCTLTVSGDSRLLACVGPSEGTVTVMDARSLDELLRVDISILELGSAGADSAVGLCFAPGPGGHLLVSTSSHKILVLDARTGRLVREVPDVHKAACSSLAVRGDARFLLTAGDRVVKVWDYQRMSSDRSQVFIGHSEPVQGAAFTADQEQVISVGDAIFVWDLLAAPESEAAPGSRRPPDPLLSPEVSPGATESGDGIPRQSVPVPSRASPPRLDGGAGPPGRGGQGAFSESDEEGVHVWGPVSPPEKRQGGGGGSSGKGVVAALLSRPRSESPRPSRSSPEARRPEPDSGQHLLAHSETPALPERASRPSAGSERLRLKAVVGYNGNGRGNMVWRPDTGFFAYTCGCVVVVEDLHSGSQRHWLGHPEEISTLAVSHDAQVLASASGEGSGVSRCQVRIWDVEEGTAHRVLFHHQTAVQAMAFSRDDRLLITLGDPSDGTLALWSTLTYKLLSSTRLSEPAHGVAFSPFSADGMACVGRGGITFWLLDQRGPDVHLKIHRVAVPSQVGRVELTSLCYGAPPLLYGATGAGQICVWDAETPRCFMSWQADEGQIGLLWGSGNRLVSGSSSKRLRLWAVGTAQELRLAGSGARSGSVLLEHEMILDGAAVSASFDDSTDMGIVGTAAGTLWYVHWAENTSIRLISGHKNKVNDVAFGPGESHCATGGEDGSVRVWSLATMELVVQFQVLSQSCRCLAWSPPPRAGVEDPQRVAAGYGDGTLRLFGVSRTELELKMRPHSAALTAVAFAAGGETILSGGEDGLVAVSSPRSGITVRLLRDHEGSPITAIQTGSQEARDFGLEGGEPWLAASADRRLSVWASDWLKDRCRLVDWLSAPAPVVNREVSSRPLAAFCPWDESLVVCTGFGVQEDVIFYNLDQKQVVERIPLANPAASLSLSPAARLLAIGFREGLLRLMDCRTRAERDFVGHGHPAHLCRFTPSGQLLFTASSNSLLVWEVTDQ